MRSVHSEIQTLQVTPIRFRWRRHEKILRCIANISPFETIEGPILFVLHKKLERTR